MFLNVSEGSGIWSKMSKAPILQLDLHSRDPPRGSGPMCALGAGAGNWSQDYLVMFSILCHLFPETRWETHFISPCFSFPTDKMRITPLYCTRDAIICFAMHKEQPGTSSLNYSYCRSWGNNKNKVSAREHSVSACVSPLQRAASVLNKQWQKSNEGAGLSQSSRL